MFACQPVPPLRDLHLPFSGSATGTFPFSSFTFKFEICARAQLFTLTQKTKPKCRGRAKGHRYVSGQKTQRAQPSGRWHGKQQQEEMWIGNNVGANPPKSTLVEGRSPAPRGGLLHGPRARFSSSRYGLRPTWYPSARGRPAHPWDPTSTLVPPLVWLCPTLSSLTTVHGGISDDEPFRPHVLLRTSR